MMDTQSSGPQATIQGHDAPTAMPPPDDEAFERQKQDVDEIEEALKELVQTQDELLAEHQYLCAAVITDRRLQLLPRRAAVRTQLDEVEGSIKGRLIMAGECQKANQAMLDSVIQSWLAPEEQKMLSGIRLQLSRIMLQYGRR